MPPLWCISAARIVHDQREATISYQDAQFELFGVPVLYLPYFQHPDPSVKRRSGFLAPSYANSSTLGFGAELPYYFALAPNYDFTFHPQYWSKQGVLWQGDFRHRLADGQYNVKIAAIDQGRDESGATINGEQGWRGSLETKGQFSLSSWWRYGWDITVESDETFRRFYKLDPILQTDRVNTIYLQGMSERNYLSARLYHFGGLLLDEFRASRFARASRHRLQLHRRPTGARWRVELYGPCPLHVAQRWGHGQHACRRRGELAPQDDRPRRAGLDALRQCPRRRL